MLTYTFWLKSNLVILLFLGLTEFSIGQVIRTASYNFSTEDGLPGNSTYFIHQDSVGYIWVGTEYGIVRFDGHEFKQLPGPDGINNEQVFDIQEDSNGRIWFDTPLQGLFYVDNDTIYPWQFNHLFLSNQDSFRIITGFYVQPDSTVFIELERWGIMEVDVSGNYLVHKADNEYCNYLIYNAGDHMLINRGKEIRVDLLDSLYKEKLSPGVYLKEGLKGKVIYPFAENKNLGLGSRSAVLGWDDNSYILYHIGKLRFLQDDQILWERPFPHNNIEIFRDPTGSVVFCNIRNEGVQIYYGLDDIKFGKEPEVYLSGFSVTGFCKDKYSGYWFSTLEKGIFYIPDDRIKEVSIPEGIICDIEVSDDQIYTCLKNGQVLAVEKTGDAKSTGLYLELDREIHDSEVDEATGKLFVSTKNTFYIKQDDKLDEVILSAGISLRRFALLKDDQRIIGIGGSGYVVFNRRSAEVEYYSGGKYIDPTRFSDVFVGRNGDIFICGSTGLFQVDPQQYSDPRLILPRRIDYLEELGTGEIVAINRNGHIFLVKGSKIREIVIDKLEDDALIRCVFMDNDQLWMGLKDGLYKVDLSQGEDTVSLSRHFYGQFEGKINSISKIDNSLILGTTSKLFIIPVSRQRKNNIKPYIEQITINGHPMDQATAISLGVKDRVRVAFTTFNYVLSGDVEYRYRINDDVAWTYTSSHSLDLQYLKVGNYNLSIQSKNEVEEWSESTSLAFSVIPPWWATWWFRGFIILLVATMAYGIYLDKTNDLKRRIEAQRRIKHLEKSALQAQMNPHFIFNCLSAIQYLINNDQKEKANDYLVRFAKLVRQTMHNSTNKTIRLNEEIDLLKNYVDLEQLRFEHEFDFSLHLNEDISPLSIKLPPMIIQPYVENAIVHGLAKKNDKGKISVSFDLEDDYLVVVIEDNGLGIEQARTADQSMIREHRSVGMTVSRERIKLLNRSEDGPDVEVQQVLDGQGRSGGTRIILHIRLTEN